MNIPSPVHFLHAPNGLLKENILGVSSPMAILCSGHAKFLEKTISFSMSTFTIIIPFETSAAVSTASVIRERSLPFMIIRSTTISILCFWFLESSIFSLVSFFTNSLKNALKANIEIRKNTYPDDVEAFEEQSIEYQEKLYDDLKDYLSSAKGQKWKLKSKDSIDINGVKFNGQASQIYDILKSFEEVSGYAYIYQYYKLFSQSEHFSMKGRIINYKQYYHEEYYNKVRCFIYLGAELLYNKYSKS